KAAPKEGGRAVLASRASCGGKDSRFQGGGPRNRQKARRLKARCKSTRAQAFRLAMKRSSRSVLLGAAAALSIGVFASPRTAHADDATVTVGQAQRFADPPNDPSQNPRPQPIAVDPSSTQFDNLPQPGELRRSPFRLTLGPAG